jgi:hypothetical protein
MGHRGLKPDQAFELRNLGRPAFGDARAVPVREAPFPLRSRGSALPPIAMDR